MKNMLGLVIVILLGVGILGYMRGWFNLQNDPTTGKTKLVVDKDKFQKDRKEATTYLTDKKNELSKSLAGLKKKAEVAKDDEKGGIQKDIDNLTKEIAALEEHHAELTSADETKLEAMQQKLADFLAKIRKDQKP